MGLSEEIEALRVELRAAVPQNVADAMQVATHRLARSGIVARSLKAGDRMPAFALPNARGELVSSDELLAAAPLVLSFYRGGWCAYCRLELRALQQALPEIQALGAQLVAISPQTPDSTLTTAEQHRLTFPLLSDVGNRVARKFGLVFALPDELRPVYREFGISIPAHNGDYSYELPIPATYLVDPDGTVLLAFVDPDHTRRLDPRDLLRALQARVS